MDALEPGTVIAGRYTVVEEIGRGGMGAVYRVEHVHTGECLALKVLVGAARFDPQAVTRFKREARAATKIGSEHVVRVTDADTAPELEGSPFLVMELLRGTDLEKYVVRNGPMLPETVIHVLAQVARVLETAHGLGIVHRDLKPENLFLHERDDGTTIAKVLDFGISKFVSAEHALETAAMTSTGSVLGTPLYMAPEQAHGQNDKIAPTTDVWAMGLIALRLLTAEHYWGTPTMVELMMKIAVKPIVPPSERWPGGEHMSPELDAWFLKSCCRDQSTRWPSVEQQIAELAAVFGVPLSHSVPSSLALPIRPARTSAHEAALALADTEHAEPTASGSRRPEALAIESRARSAGSVAPSEPVSVTGAEAISALSRSSRTSAKPPRSRLVPLGGLAAVALLGAVGVAQMRERAPASPASSSAAESTLGAVAAPTHVTIGTPPITETATSPPPSALALATASAPALTATKARTSTLQVRAGASGPHVVPPSSAAVSASAPSGSLYAPLAP